MSNDILKEAVEITQKLTSEEFQQIIIESGLDKITFNENDYIDDNVTIILPNEDLNIYLHKKNI